MFIKSFVAMTIRFIMHFCRSICLTFALLSLIACTDAVVQKPVNKPPLPLAQAKKNPPSIQSYALVDTSVGQRLLQAKKDIKSANYAAALQQLDIINYASLTSEQRSLFNVLSAQIALSNADAEKALTKLDLVRPILLNDNDKMDYYQSLAFAQTLNANVLPAVNARIRLGSLLTDTAAQQENLKTIMAMLMTLSLAELSVPEPKQDELSAWLALAKIFKQGGDVHENIQTWWRTSSVHPVNAEFLENYLTGLSTPKPSETIGGKEPKPMTAVLLPVSGSFAQAAKAIKDGLLLAQQQAGKSEAILPLKFYDTEQMDIVSLYQQVVAEGAKQVIGPLLKEQIQTLAKNTELPVPVLALNHVDDLVKNNLTQFGLSPLDDAEQLALKAWRDGRQSALYLLPDTSQGQRIGQYLTTAWQRLGGSVLGMQSYAAKQHDIADVLMALLATVSSNSLQNLAVFISATPELASELAVKLKTQPHQEFAIYAMPNVYRGHASPVHDSELGKMTFCDIPWLFAEVYKGALSQAALQNTWQSYADNQIRLLALGIDAYQLSGNLGQLVTQPYSGATGRLGVNSENRITRKLVCAQFQGGVPAVSGFVE